MRIRIATALCVGLVAAQANAADGGFFKFNPAIVGGVSVGQLSLENDAYQSPTGLRGFDANGTAWTAFVGFELNDYFSAEIGRFNGGTPSQETVLVFPTVASPVAVTDISDIKNNGWTASALAAYPISEIVSVYGRAGIYRWSSSIKVTRRDDVFDPAALTAIPLVPLSSTFLRTQTGTVTGNDVLLGVGIGLNIDSGQIRLEYAKTEVNNADTRFISLIASWRFRPWK